MWIEPLENRALLDALAPVSQVEELEDETGVESFLVSWSGADEAGGSALANFDVLVSINNGPFEPWLTGTTETSAIYEGTYGREYAFYSIARDNVGNVEAPPLEADAETDVVPTWIAASSGAEFAITGAGAGETRTFTVNHGTITLVADAGVFMAGLEVVVTGDSRLVLEHSQHFGSLNIAHADAEVVADAGGECYLHTGALSIALGGYLDLNDNEIIGDYDEGDASPFAQLQQWVISGYATSGSAPKTGIISGTGRTSDGLTILALTDVTQDGPVEWPRGSGNVFDHRGVIGKQVYFGDMNLDGLVTGDDYTRIDANLGQIPVPGQEWLSGDSNLDHLVTGDDYTMIDANLGRLLPPDWLKVPWDTRFTISSTSGLPSFNLANGEATFVGEVASNPMLNVSVAAGSLLVLDRTQRLGKLSLATGGRVILPPGGDNHLVVEELLLAPGVTINVSDNDLIVQKGDFQRIQALVIGGFRSNPDPGATGIVSTLSQRGGGNAISALLDNKLLKMAQWKGVPLSPDAVIATYALIGDLNLDGRVTVDDYTVIDANARSDPPMGVEWLHGDANLDGLVTDDDYSVIDAALGGQLPRGPHNTGPTDRSRLVVRDPFTVRQDGAVIENVHVIGGKIEIQANNVTIRNFIIEANVTVAIKIHGGYTGTVIEDGEITGPETTNGITGSNYTARRLHVHHMGADAFRVARNVTIEDCYVHDVGIKPESHGDIVQMFPLDGTNIVIRGNHFDARGANAALFQVENGWLVENNYLNGGNYSVFGSGQAVNTYINNIFGRDFRYGAIRIGSGDEALLNWQGNIYHETGELVLP